MGRKERKKGRPERFSSYFFHICGEGERGTEKNGKKHAIKMTQQNNKYPSVWERRGEEALGSERGKVKGRKEKKRKEKKRKEKKRKRKRKKGKRERNLEIPHSIKKKKKKERKKERKKRKEKGKGESLITQKTRDIC